MGWRSKLGKGMALVGAGCLAVGGLLTLSADERPPSEVSAGVVAAEEPDPGSDDDDDDKDREKRESSTTSATAEKDRAETTTSTRRRSQASSSTSTTDPTTTTSKRSATSTTTTEPEKRSSGASTTTTTAAPAPTTTQPAATSTSTTATTTQRAAGTEPSTTTTTAPSSVPTALITEPARRGGPGGAPVGAAQSVGPDTESRGPRLPTASTGPRPPGAPAGPVPSSAPAESPASSTTTAPAVTFESVTPNGIGGADLPPDQLQGAPGEVTDPAGAVPTPAPGRRPSGVLGMTGSTTRTMLLMAGAILLLGALIIAFGESMTRARGPLPGHTVAAAWGESVPLAPSKREKARRRAGIRPS